jgi:hypothetical protein
VRFERNPFRDPLGFLPFSEHQKRKLIDPMDVVAILDLERTAKRFIPILDMMRDSIGVSVENRFVRQLCYTQSKIPPTIRNLRHLHHLDLRGVNMKMIPSVIWELEQITTLILSDNRIEAIPPSIAQLHNLVELDLQHNHIYFLPQELTQCTKLKRLWLQENNLSEIPPILCDLPALLEVNLDGGYYSGIDEDLLKEFGCHLEGENLIEFLNAYKEHHSQI